MGRQCRSGSGVKWLNHYSSAQSILVVGDGDMSFSLALAAAFGSGKNLVATSLDSYGVIHACASFHGERLQVVLMSRFAVQTLLCISFLLCLITYLVPSLLCVMLSSTSAPVTYVLQLQALEMSDAALSEFGEEDQTVILLLSYYNRMIEMDALTSKYGKAESNVTELERLGATVFHGVNAKKMNRCPCLKMRRFDRIVFNFPHVGFIGHENHDHVIEAHQLLVRRFFRNASLLLHTDGEIHVSHKTGQPYDRWQIEELASKFSVVISEVVTFPKEDYPGYNQKRGDGDWCDKEFPLLNGCTYKFLVEQRGEAGEACCRKFTAVQTESLHRLQESLDDVTKLHQEKEQQVLLLQQELISISGCLGSCEHARSTLESKLEEGERRIRKFTTAQTNSQHRLRESLDAVTKLHQEKEQQQLVLQQELISISGSLHSCEQARSTLESRLEEEERNSRKFTTAQRESQHRL